MSGDAYANKDGTSDAAGDPSFTVSIDGKQIGGTFITVAPDSAGQTQSFLLNGTFGTGSHTVAVTFLNDAWGGTSTTDRNLYVNDLVYLGTDTKDSSALYSNGTQKFSVTGGTAPTPDAYAYANTNTHAYADTYANSRADTDAYAYAYADTHANTDAYPHADADARRHLRQHRRRAHPLTSPPAQAPTSLS